MKLTRILLIAGLAALLVAACACTGDPGTDTPTTVDTTAPVDEPTEAPTNPPAAKVDITITVKDQKGNPMPEAVITILPATEDGESATLTADDQGVVTVSLTEGEYTVRFDVLPEYVLGIDAPLTVTVGMEPVTLEVIDNTPDGSVDHPLIISDDRITASIPAGETLHFSLFGANNRTLTLDDPNTEVFYENVTYRPDEEGKIAVRMTTENPRDHSFFAVTNTGSETRDVTVIILSDPGAMDNPIEITALGEAVTAIVPKDGMVYYTWTATGTGTLTLTSEDSFNNISLNNLATSQVTNFTEGKTTETLPVTEGDHITIVVSVIGGDPNAETNAVTFTLSLAE